MATDPQQSVSPDGAGVAHFVMDGEGNIVEWDAASEGIFGWTRDEALGAKLSELIIPPEQRAIHEYGLMRYKATGQGKFIGKPLQIVTLHRDGSEVPIAITISMERDGAGYRFPSVARVVEKKPAA
jgi:PAS domain S-box-containing protein